MSVEGCHEVAGLLPEGGACPAVMERSLEYLSVYEGYGVVMVLKVQVECLFLYCEIFN